MRSFTCPPSPYLEHVVNCLHSHLPAASVSLGNVGRRRLSHDGDKLLSPQSAHPIHGAHRPCKCGPNNTFEGRMGLELGLSLSAHCRGGWHRNAEQQRTRALDSHGTYRALSCCSASLPKSNESNEVCGWCGGRFGLATG